MVILLIGRVLHIYLFHENTVFTMWVCFTPRYSHVRIRYENNMIHGHVTVDSSFCFEFTISDELQTNHVWFLILIRLNYVI